MAHTGIFATSDEILVKAGANYDTGITEARINALCLQVEAQINATCEFNYSDTYSTLNADVKGLLSEAASNLVAIYIIMYETSGYASIREVEDRLVILIGRAKACLGMLSDKEKQRFINQA